MSRPNTKADLLGAAQKEYTALLSEIASLSTEEITAPGLVGEWSVKDVLAHLAAWSELCMGWYATQQRGEPVQAPFSGYKWSETPALNQTIFERYCAMPLDEVLTWLNVCHEQILVMVTSISDEELWTPDRCTWSSAVIGSSFVSATSSHYQWARKEIRKGIKTHASTS